VAAIPTTMYYYLLKLILLKAAVRKIFKVVAAVQHIKEPFLKVSNNFSNSSNKEDNMGL